MKIKKLEALKKIWLDRIASGVDYVVPARIIELIDVLLDAHNKEEDITSDAPVYLKPQPKKWKPEEGEKYWYMSFDDGKVDSGVYAKTHWASRDRYNFGNVFQTEELAKRARDKIKELLTNL